MHSYAWANYSPSMDVYADQPEQDDVTGGDRVCIVPGCGGEHFCHKLCRIHYKRWARTGTAEGLSAKRDELIEAAVTLPDTHSIGARLRMVRAAVDYSSPLVVRYVTPPEVLTAEVLGNPAVGRLLRAAETFADLPAEEPLSRWEASLRELVKASAGVAMALGHRRERKAA